MEVAAGAASRERGRPAADCRSSASHGSGLAADAAALLGGRAAPAEWRFRARGCQRAEQLNYDVYRPQIEALIANQRFRDYEMPANSDTTFWTNLGYTARRPFRTLQDYRNWIAQLHDLPRYFHEQMDEMRAGLRRGFTPPRVTMDGRDASITAVTDATPEQSLFYTPFREMPGIAAHGSG